ncbi:alanine racemase [Streptomyces aidingensis]|uniref:D-serine deaminase, pyridoxal phosphate-dependent n=1 Tax=Streptomyces aidingensis TaxID=910347 RepID=A0A1I1SH77_9ACTN|nr:alanine racemase [Streptomyces aidingensis]SFD45834.1 D-serine deaminase, pyridoxal phosphate-dependent [Streptomyces aidingensis]
MTGSERADGVGFARLERATRVLEPPYAVIDLAALRENAAGLARRAGGKPVRPATHAVRCRSLLRMVLELPGFRGLLAQTLPEALWLAEEFEDVLVASPTADPVALHRLATDRRLAGRITLMADRTDHLDLIADAVRAARGRPGGGRPLRVCLDLDASLRLLGGRLRFGARRSPVHRPAQAAALARATLARPALRLAGVRCHETRLPAVRLLRRMSRAELRRRRAEAVAAVRAVAPLEFVSGGGTGSLADAAAEAAVTELTAGSGLLGPAPPGGQPAAFFVHSVVRVPDPRTATVLGGGWVASGPAGPDRLPVPVWPPGLRLTRQEGAGEVETPLTGPGAAGLGVGDRVWFRHGRAGELAERVTALHLLDGDRISGTAATYRGEGRAFV